MTTTDHFSESLELLREAKGGNAVALRRLMERYRGRLLARIRLMMGPEARRTAESADFLQGVLLDVLEDFEQHRLKDEHRFLRWMSTIARNNITDAVRRRRERALDSLSMELAGQPGIGEPSPTPASEAAYNERLHLLAEALEGLSEDHREVIELRSLDRLRLSEVARAMDRSEEAARKLHNRAMVQLGRILGRTRD